MIEIKSETNQLVSIGDHLYGESGLYILEGGIESEGNVYEPRQMLIAGFYWGISKSVFWEESRQRL